MILDSCEDFRRAAQRRLPRFLFDYLDGGANRETTLGRNLRDLQEVRSSSAYCAMSRAST